jgi:hypothetical protein
MPELPAGCDANWIQLVVTLNRIGWSDNRIAHYTRQTIDFISAIREATGINHPSQRANEES